MKKVPENVVDEEEHVLTFLVAEIFGDGETGEGDTCTGAWGLVHLSVDECDLVSIDVIRYCLIKTRLTYRKFFK